MICMALAIIAAHTCTAAMAPAPGEIVSPAVLFGFTHFFLSPTDLMVAKQNSLCLDACHMHHICHRHKLLMHLSACMHQAADHEHDCCILKRD